MFFLFPGWLRVIIVSVSLTVLIISVVGVNVWIKTKGKNFHRLNFNEQVKF